MAVGPRLDSSKLARPTERDHMYVDVYSEVRGRREGITSLTQVARLSRHPLPTAHWPHSDNLLITHLSMLLRFSYSKLNADCFNTYLLILTMV